MRRINGVIVGVVFGGGVFCLSVFWNLCFVDFKL